MRLTEQELNEIAGRIKTLYRNYGFSMIMADSEKLVSAYKELLDEKEKWRKEAFRKYPTPEAYEAVCKALETHKEENAQLKNEFDRLATVCASAVVTIRDQPEQANDMVEFLLNAVKGGDTT